MSGFKYHPEARLPDWMYDLINAGRVIHSNDGRIYLMSGKYRGWINPGDVLAQDHNGELVIISRARGGMKRD